MGINVVLVLNVRFTGFVFRVLSQMSCFLVPRLYFSFPKGCIGPAWPDISWSCGSGCSLWHSILQPSKKCLFSGMLFWCLFCRIGNQTGPEMWQKVSLWDLPGDAMLQYVVIFSTLVFERPYSVLAIFSNVSWARNVKKPSTKTLETYLAARCEKNTLRNLKNQRKKQKTTPIEVQLGTRATNKLRLFLPRCPYARPNRCNDLPRVPHFTKMMPPMLLRCPQVAPRFQKLS